MVVKVWWLRWRSRVVAKVEGSRVLLLRPVRIVGGRKRSREEEQGKGKE